jgi:hypothetical protein
VYIVVHKYKNIFRSWTTELFCRDVSLYVIAFDLHFGGSRFEFWSGHRVSDCVLYFPPSLEANAATISFPARSCSDKTMTLSGRCTLVVSLFTLKCRDLGEDVLIPIWKHLLKPVMLINHHTQQCFWCSFLLCTYTTCFGPWSVAIFRCYVTKYILRYSKVATYQVICDNIYSKVENIF